VLADAVLDGVIPTNVALQRAPGGGIYREILIVPPPRS